MEGRRQCEAEARILRDPQETHLMSPAQTIIHRAQETFSATDKRGRKLLLRRLTAFTLRLFKAADPDLSQNTSWLSMAGLAFSVLEIDGVPIPPPTTESQIENVVDLVG